jgi:hypothetical protein
MKNALDSRLGLGLTLVLAVSSVGAGPLDPDCTAEKAAKSAAAKATVGVGGRCDPKEAAKDTVGLDGKDKKDKKDRKDHKDKKSSKDADDSNGWSVSK